MLSSIIKAILHVLDAVFGPFIKLLGDFFGAIFKFLWDHLLDPILEELIKWGIFEYTIAGGIVCVICLYLYVNLKDR